MMLDQSFLEDCEAILDGEEGASEVEHVAEAAAAAAVQPAAWQYALACELQEFFFQKRHRTGKLHSFLPCYKLCQDHTIFF